MTVVGVGQVGYSSPKRDHTLHQFRLFLHMDGEAASGRRTRLGSADPSDLVVLAVSLIEPTFHEVPRAHVLGFFL